MTLLALFLFIAPTYAHDAQQGRFDLGRLRPDVIEFVKTQPSGRDMPRRFQNSEELGLQRWVNEFTRVPANEPYFKGLELEVWVDPSHYPQAIVSPDGKIRVTRGLMDLFGVNRPQYVQAILAHELAHMARAHTFQKASAMIGSQSIAQFSARGCTSFFSCKGLFERLDDLALSRAFEFEADHLALELMNNAKMDPALFVVALQALDGPQVDRPAPKRGRIRNALHTGLKNLALACSTHPLTCDRVSSIFAELKEHGYEHAWSAVPKPPATTLKWLSEVAKRVKI